MTMRMSSISAVIAARRWTEGSMRLIDADALLDTIAIVSKNFAKTDAQKALMGRVMYIIEHRREDIVHCKDCKHWASHQHVKYGVCQYFEDVCETQVHTRAEDFCSHGEREVQTDER